MIVLLQLFWLSFFVLGAALLKLSAASRRPALKGFNRIIAALPLPAVAFVAVCAAFAGVAPLVAAAYLIELPVLAFVCLYLALLVAAIGYLIQQRSWLRAAVRHRLPASRAGWLVATAVAVSLGSDYILALHTKGLLAVDAPVHIARINLIAHGRFELADPYFSRHGQVDPRYSTNLLLGLQAVAARLLHQTAVWVWFYSVGFFRLLIWLSVFFLCWNIFSASVRQRWSYIFLVLAPPLLGFFFVNVEFPDRIVLAWIALLIAGLKVYLESDNALLLIGASALIAVTHSLYALISIGFLVLLAVGLLVMRRLSKRRLRDLALCTALLCFPLLLNLVYPNRTASSRAAFNSPTISGASFIPHHYGRLYLSLIPQPVSFSELALAAVVLVVFCLSTRIKNRSWLQRLFFGLGSSIALLGYYPVYLSLLGFFLIMLYLKKRELRLMLGLLVVYYGLIAYDPLVVPLIAGRVPPWVVARFQEFNILALLTPYVAILAWAEFPRQHLRDSRLTAVLYVLIIPLYLFVVPHIYPGVPPIRLASYGARQYTDNAYNMHISNALQQLSPELQNRTIYSDDKNPAYGSSLSFYIPAVVPGANVVTTLDTNYSPMTNIPAHDKCGQILAKNLAADDLRAANVTRVIARQNSGLSTLAAERPYLHFLKAADGYAVYGVAVPRSAHAAVSACSIPWGQ